jgi:hypothetical protein
MNWKGSGRKRSVVSQNLPGRTEVNHKKSQSGQSGSRPRFERSTFRIQVYRITSRPARSLAVSEGKVICNYLGESSNMNVRGINHTDT